METWAIILAAGQGSRMASVCQGKCKQLLEWQSAPLFWHSARCFSRIARLRGIIFVFPQELVEEANELITQLSVKEPLGLPWKICAGGARRQDSVRCGLAELPSVCTHVLVHDAARPFVDAALVNRVLNAMQDGHHAVIPAIALCDTIKEVENSFVLQTPERSKLKAVQTPQGFFRKNLERAYALCDEHQWNVSDDASLIENAAKLCDKAQGSPNPSYFTGNNGSIFVVEGNVSNVKITNPEDMALLQNFAPTPRVRTVNGFGYDVHRYVTDGRPMRLGGVDIPNAPQIAAHSDGDVLLHALMDAILSCCAGGDIGKLFPDTAPEWDNADSSLLLSEVLELAARRDVSVYHADITVIAQIPRISPWREQIQRNVARLLHLPMDSVNVKATTEEGLGFTGEKKGIKAVALVSAEQKLPTPQV